MATKTFRDWLKSRPSTYRLGRVAAIALRTSRRVIDPTIYPACSGPACPSSHLDRLFENSLLTVGWTAYHKLNGPEGSRGKWYPRFSDLEQPVPSLAGVTKAYRCTVLARADEYGNEAYRLKGRRTYGTHTNPAYWIVEAWYPNYFHWMVFHATKLALFKFHQLDGFILLPEAAQRVSYISETLQALRLENRVRHFPMVPKLKIGNIRILWRGGFPRRGLHLLRSYLLDGHKETGERKQRIYLSRARAGWRRAINEKEVVGLLSRRGFLSTRLEDHTLYDQAACMSQVSMLVGVHGAGLTNMLFMPTGSTVVELLPAGADSALYCVLAGILGHRYICVECSRSAGEGINADVEVPLETLEQVLASLD